MKTITAPNQREDGMDPKLELIITTVRQLQRFAAKYAKVEELPIPVEDGLQVTTREAHTVQAIGQRGSMTVTEVAQTFGVTKSAASQTVSRLVNKGFLTKTPSPLRVKEFQLNLTPLGQKVLEAHDYFHGADRDELLKRLESFSRNQIATIAVLLEARGDVMDKRMSR